MSRATMAPDDVFPPVSETPAFVMLPRECYSTVVPSVTAVVGGEIAGDLVFVEAIATRETSESVHLAISTHASKGAATLVIPLALFPHLAALINELYWRSAEARLLETGAPWFDSMREFDVNADIIAVKP